MLCNNCAAHSSDVRLTNIKLVFLLSNTTLLIQPMDQGYIANFKCHCRSLVLRQLIAAIDDNSDASVRAMEMTNKLMLLDSLHMQKEDWSRITAQTIINCYRLASFIKEMAANTDTVDRQARARPTTKRRATASTCRPA